MHSIATIAQLLLLIFPCCRAFCFHDSVSPSNRIGHRARGLQNVAALEAITSIVFERDNVSTLVAHVLGAALALELHKSVVFREAESPQMLAQMLCASSESTFAVTAVHSGAPPQLWCESSSAHPLVLGGCIASSEPSLDVRRPIADSWTAAGWDGTWERFVGWTANGTLSDVRNRTRAGDRVTRQWYCTLDSHAVTFGSVCDSDDGSSVDTADADATLWLYPPPHDPQHYSRVRLPGYRPPSGQSCWSRMDDTDATPRLGVIAWPRAPQFEHPWVLAVTSAATLESSDVNSLLSSLERAEWARNTSQTVEAAVCTWLQSSSGAASVQSWVSAIPTIREVTPSEGPTTGAFEIEISGSGLGLSAPPWLAIWIGPSPCDSPRWISDSRLSCLIPTGSGRSLPVRVVIGNVDAAIEAEVEFSYYPAILLEVFAQSSSQPDLADEGISSRDITPGGWVRLLGLNFVNSPAMSCRFGRETVVVAAFVSFQEVLCRVPALGIGETVVAVSNDGERWSDDNVLTDTTSFAWPTGRSTIPLDYGVSLAPREVVVLIAGPARLLRVAVECVRQAIGAMKNASAILPHTHVRVEAVDSSAAMRHSRPADRYDALRTSLEAVYSWAGPVAAPLLAMIGITGQDAEALASEQVQRYFLAPGGNVAEGSGVTVFGLQDSWALNRPEAKINRSVIERVMFATSNDLEMGSAVMGVARFFQQELAAAGFLRTDELDIVLLVPAHERDAIGHVIGLDVLRAARAAVQVSVEAVELSAGVASVDRLRSQLGRALDRTRVVVTTLTHYDFTEVARVWGAISPAHPLNATAWLVARPWLSESAIATAETGALLLVASEPFIPVLHSGAARLQAHLRTVSPSDALLVLHDLQLTVCAALELYITRVRKSNYSTFEFTHASHMAEYFRAAQRIQPRLGVPPVSSFAGFDGARFARLRTQLAVYEWASLQQGPLAFVEPTKVQKDGSWSNGPSIGELLDTEVYILREAMPPLRYRGVQQPNRVVLGLIIPESGAGTGLLSVVGAVVAMRKAQEQLDSAHWSLSVTRSVPRLELDIRVPRDSNIVASTTEMLQDYGLLPLSSGLRQPLARFRNASLVAVMGPRRSALALEMASITAAANVSLLDFGSFTSLLSDRAAFPYYIRVNPPTHSLANALVNTLELFGWRSVSIFMQQDVYSESIYAAFHGFAQSQNISVLHTIVSPASDSHQDLVQRWSRLASEDARIIIVLAVSIRAADFVRAAIEARFFTRPDTACIGADSFLDFLWFNNGSLDSRMLNNTQGFLVVSPIIDPTQTAGLSAALQHELAALIDTGKWPHFARAELGSSVGGPAARAPHATPTMLPVEAAPILLSTIGMPASSTRWQGAYAHDAVLTASHALNEMLRDEVPLRAGPQLHAYLRNVVFRGLTGYIRFSSSANDRRAATYALYNVQGTDVRFRGPSVDEGFVYSRGCPAGKQRSPGSVSCEDCPMDTYNPSAGSGSCLRCPSVGGGERTTTQGRTGAATQADCKCPANYFQVSGIDKNGFERIVRLLAGDAQSSDARGRASLHSGFACFGCPQGARCTTPGVVLSDVPAQPGFWRGHPNATTFMRCVTPQQCEGGVVRPTPSPLSGKAGLWWTFSTSCSNGAMGPGCLECEGGYGRFRIGTPCHRCLPRGTVTLLAVVVAIGFASFALYVVYKRTKTKRISPESTRMNNNLKVFVTFLQINSSLQVFGLSRSGELARAWQLQQNVMSVAATSLFGTCLLSPDSPAFHQEFLIAVAGLASSAGVALLTAGLVSCRSQRRSGVNVSLGTDVLICASALLLFLSYPSVLEKAMQGLSCRNLRAMRDVFAPDEESAPTTRYLAADTRVACDSESFRGVFVACALTVAVLSLLVPAFVCLTVRRNRSILFFDKGKRLQTQILDQSIIKLLNLMVERAWAPGASPTPLAALGTKSADSPCSQKADDSAVEVTPYGVEPRALLGHELPCDWHLERRPQVTGARSPAQSQPTGADLVSSKPRTGAPTEGHSRDAPTESVLDREMPLFTAQLLRSFRHKSWKDQLSVLRYAASFHERVKSQVRRLQSSDHSAEWTACKAALEHDARVLHFQRRWGFLYRSYRPERAHWEAFVFARKVGIALSSVLAISVSETSTATLAPPMLVLLLALILNATYEPYSTQSPFTYFSERALSPGERSHHFAKRVATRMVSRSAIPTRAGAWQRGRASRENSSSADSQRTVWMKNGAAQLESPTSPSQLSLEIESPTRVSACRCAPGLQSTRTCTGGSRCTGRGVARRLVSAVLHAPLVLHTGHLDSLAICTTLFTLVLGVVTIREATEPSDPASALSVLANVSTSLQEALQAVTLATFALVIGVDALAAFRLVSIIDFTRDAKDAREYMEYRERYHLAGVNDPPDMAALRAILDSSSSPEATSSPPSRDQFVSKGVVI